jgi:hypothetical protein
MLKPLFLGPHFLFIISYLFQEKRPIDKGKRQIDVLSASLYARYARITTKRIRVAHFQAFTTRHELRGLLLDVQLAVPDDLVCSVAGDDLASAVMAPHFLESRHVIHVANFAKIPGFSVPGSQKLRDSLASDAVISELMTGYRGTVTARRYTDTFEVGIICLNSMFIQYTFIYNVYVHLYVYYVIMCYNVYMFIQCLNYKFIFN